MRAVVSAVAADSTDGALPPTGQAAAMTRMATAAIAARAVVVRGELDDSATGHGHVSC